MEREGLAARQAAVTTYVTERRRHIPEAAQSWVDEANSINNGDNNNPQARIAHDDTGSPNTSTLIEQVSKSLRQVNQSEGARFERLFGALAESNQSSIDAVEAMHDLSASVADLARAQAETNAILRATLGVPQQCAPAAAGPVFVGVPPSPNGPPFPPPPLQTPEAGPSHKRARTELDH